MKLLLLLLIYTWHVYEDVGDEDKEVDEADNGWGGGTVGEAENGRRGLNGEFGLAIRGYGELWHDFVLCFLL